MAKTVVETIEMYNGEVILDYLPNSHTYKVEGDKKIGVTTITGVINKEALMLWPLGEAITLLRRELVDKPKKMDATSLRFSIPEIEALLEKAAKQYTVKQLRGTDAGTMGHDWLEQYLRAVKDNTKLPAKLIRFDETTFKKMDEWDDERIRMEDHNHICEAIDAFIAWFKENDVEIIDIERIIYSREYDYAGRFDAILRINGKIYLIDFKTSNPSREFQEGVYPENFAQLGGYDIAYTEEHPDVEVEGHAIFNLSKKNGKLSIKYSEDRDLNREFFLMALGTKRGMQHHTRNLSIKYQEKRKK